MLYIARWRKKQLIPDIGLKTIFDFETELFRMQEKIR